MDNRLREAREKCGKTQQQVADAVGISLKSYQRIEKGEQDPAVSTAKRIAKTLKSTVERLF